MPTPIHSLVTPLIDGSGGGIDSSSQTSSSEEYSSTEKTEESNIVDEILNEIKSKSSNIEEEIDKALSKLPKNWRKFVECLILSLNNILIRGAAKSMTGKVATIVIAYTIATIILTLPYIHEELEELQKYVTDPFKLITYIKILITKIIKKTMETCYMHF